MVWRISSGGSTCGTLDFSVQLPNPGTSSRSRTLITRSWCQPSIQFRSGVLSNARSRTARAVSPASLYASVPSAPPGPVSIRNTADGSVIRLLPPFSNSGRSLSQSSADTTSGTTMTPASSKTDFASTVIVKEPCRSLPSSSSRHPGSSSCCHDRRVDCRCLRIQMPASAC